METEVDDDSLDEREHLKEEEEGSASLPENVFSLMFVAPIRSHVFFLSIFFFLFQISFFALALSDLIDRGGENEQSHKKNVLALPASVALEVRIAAVLAFLIAMPVFGDMMEALETLNEGYDQDMALRQNPHATRWKWLFAYTLQFLGGALLLATTFIVVARSVTVIDIFFNVCALEFISGLDDLLFKLALRGYFSESMLQLCEHVSEFKTPELKTGRWFRRTGYVITTLALLAGYSAIWWKQDDPDYLCKRLEVQFGDAFFPSLPMFSGFFILRTDLDRVDGRYIYTDELTNKSFFRYCENEVAWVFSWLEDDFAKDLISVCENASLWVSISPKTDGFDILETDAMSWESQSYDNFNNLLYPVDYFTLRCADCVESNCAGQCHEEINRCVCDASYGPNCQFDEPPCTDITYDRRTEPYLGEDTTYKSEFQLVAYNDTILFVYGKPVYYYGGYGDGLSAVMLSYGRRYALATFESPGGNDETLIQNLFEYFNGGSWHGYYNWWLNADGRLSDPVIQSDPMDVGSGSDRLTPVGLSWSRATFEFKSGPPIDTRYVCEYCSETWDSCVNGECLVLPFVDAFKGSCVCLNSTDRQFSGPLCEAVEMLEGAT